MATFLLKRKLIFARLFSARFVGNFPLFYDERFLYTVNYVNKTYVNKTLLGFLVIIAKLGVIFRQKIPEHIIPYLFDPFLVVSNEIGKTKAKRTPKKFSSFKLYIFKKRSLSA